MDENATDYVLLFLPLRDELTEELRMRLYSGNTFDLDFDTLQHLAFPEKLFALSSEAAQAADPGAGSFRFAFQLPLVCEIDIENGLVSFFVRKPFHEHHYFYFRGNGRNIPMPDDRS